MQTKKFNAAFLSLLLVLTASYGFAADIPALAEVVAQIEIPKMSETRVQE